MIVSQVAEKLAAAQWHKIKPECVAPDDFINQVEDSIGAPLPAEYRRFLTIWPCRSGPRRAVHCPIIEGPGKRSGAVPLMEFSGFDPKSKTLMNMDGEYRKSAVDGMLLIADDFLSNWFYIRFEDGTIWYLNRMGKGAKKFENLAMVGENFDDFVLHMQIS